MWKGRQHQQALHLLGAMQHCAIVPDVITYNVAISAHKKGQQHQRALFLRRAMRRYGIVPEGVTYNAAVSAYVKGQRRQKAYDAAPCHRAGWVHLQCCHQPVRRASSTSRHTISFERCGAMSSCRMCSPTMLLSACATGQQHQQA